MKRSFSLALALILAISAGAMLIPLTTRDVRDEESVAMLDLIFASTYYDLAHIYDLGKIGTTLRSVPHNRNENITSLYESHKKSVERAIEKTVEKFTELTD